MKKKTIMLSSILLGSLVLILGITYAVFTYQANTVNQQLILGDIYMHYTESNALNLENAMPGDGYSNYFEFKITGKNTYTKQDIYYDIKLTRGDLPEGKTESNRIGDNYLKFKLVEVNGDTETEIIKDKTYQELTNQVIHAEKIAKNTTSEVNKIYRLYMTISDELIIGNTSDAMYSSETWKDAFASIKVNVTGDFTVREVPMTGAETMQKAIANKAVSSPSCKTTVEEDGIIYISGTKDCIDFNYVWYSGKLWRITAIYPDGTVKMITDGLMTTIAYGDGGNTNFYTDENKTSYMYQWLNQEFLPTLYNYENIIVEDAVWNASPGNGEISTKFPVTGQEEVLVNSNVGLLDSYEYYMSYKNTSYGIGYLNIGYYWWLLNPYNSNISGWYVTSQGNAKNRSLGYEMGVRPTINLKSTIEFVGGVGTLVNPYRIRDDQENIQANVTLINTRQSGEYVKLLDEETAPIFRIVNSELVGENLTTKIVLNDYVRDTNDLDSDDNAIEILTREFGSTNPWSNVSETDSSYWRGYLNNTWIKEVDPTYDTETGTYGMLERGTYYLGSLPHTNRNYKMTVCKTIDNAKSIRDCIDENTLENPTVYESVTNYVGLLRSGEIFASQFGISYSSSSNMWLITPYSSSDGFYIDSQNDIHRSIEFNYNNPLSSSLGARPTIHLKSEIVIKSGSGTKTDPYVVGLPEA